MEKIVDLAGRWMLSQDGRAPIPGRLPGCTYLDYMENGMADPFWGENETKANELARHDYCYSREFSITEELLSQPRVDLVADGLDTLCTIRINGREVGRTDNINRVWRLDVKDACKPGVNTIELAFANPYPFIEERQKANPLPLLSTPIRGIGYLRKTPCHFGWDWGPKLPPAGITRSIRLEAYAIRVEDLKIRQHHEPGKVTLQITAVTTDLPDAAIVGGRVLLTDPDGKTSACEAAAKNETMQWNITLENPQLWWCNGLGEQPLYQMEVELHLQGETVQRLHRQIGLRTIELDTAPDEHGQQFRFVVNGVPIFAKGADWIPADSFITRVGRQTLFFYAQAAKRANMNLLRVWGGGMYESEDFYDACDENGILVWQDFAFACNSYPLDDPAFVQNVQAEVTDNVRRLRHRASLALWCGNNENEIVLLIRPYQKQKPLMQQNLQFYHTTLREWVDSLDGVTPYWPGSPSSGSLDKRIHSMEAGSIWGDTHLWQVWHGMRPIEAFREYPTRFCSEFGMESMPSLHTIRLFSDAEDLSLFDPVMQLHQKCGGGNEKILYYLLAKYRNPATFEDFVYLSQLVQANTIRFATDCWRRNIGAQNGAIFWQMNDCWPVASWAGIDYGNQLKAVTYHARHFNKPLCLSNDYYDDRAEIYIVNEYPRSFTGMLEWSLYDFEGGLINSGTRSVTLDAVSSQNAVVLRFADVLKGRQKSEAALSVRLLEDGHLRDEKYWLLVPDKEAALPEVSIQSSCAVDGNTAVVTLTAPSYARYVYVACDGISAPWSDNFFDIPAGQSVTVTVPLPQTISLQDLRQKLRVKSLMDVRPKNSRLKDRLLRIQMIFKKNNLLYMLAFKIILNRKKRWRI